jgi:hypothetical protein
MRGNQFLRITRIYNALVCRPRKEERRKGQQQINRKDYQYQTGNKMNGFIL